MHPFCLLSVRLSEVLATQMHALNLIEISEIVCGSVKEKIRSFSSRQLFHLIKFPAYVCLASTFQRLLNNIYFNSWSVGHSAHTVSEEAVGNILLGNPAFATETEILWHPECKVKQVNNLPNQCSCLCLHLFTFFQSILLFCRKSGVFLTKIFSHLTWVCCFPSKIQVVEYDHMIIRHIIQNDQKTYNSKILLQCIMGIMVVFLEYKTGLSSSSKLFLIVL